MVVHKRIVAAILVLFSLLGGCLSSRTGGLVGTWTGTEVGDTTGRLWSFVMTDTRMSIEMVGGPGIYRGTYTVDTSVTPHQVDTEITESQVPSYVGTSALGIYKLEGGTFTLSASEPGNPDRPTGFAPRETDNRVFVLTRQ